MQKNAMLAMMLGLSAALAGCGEDSASAAAGDDNSVTVRFTSLEDTTGLAGVAACAVHYEVDNKLDNTVKHITFDYMPTAVDTHAAQTAVNARGARRIYIRAVKSGGTKPGIQRIDGLNCSQLTGINLLTRSCGAHPDTKCDDKVWIANDTALKVATRY